MITIKRLLFVAAFLLMASANFSCEKEDVAQTEQDFQSVKKSEIEDTDT